MLKYIIIGASLCCTSLYGQVVLEKEVQKPTGKELNAFGYFSVNSAIRGSGQGPISSNMVAALEFTKIKDDGLLIRKGYTFTKYDDAMNQLWESTIEASIGLQNQTKNVTIGDQNGIYFIELKGMNGTDFFITRFDKDGKTIRQNYKPINRHNANVAFFTSEKGLCVLNVELNKKLKKHTYRLLTFSYKTLIVEEKIIALETNAYEVEQSFDLFYRATTWNLLKVVNGNVVLYKRYLNKDATTSTKEYVVKTIDMNTSGELSNGKTYKVENPKQMRLPSAELSNDGKTLWVFGFMSKKEPTFTDGVYVQKIDYATGMYQYKKEYPFSNLVNGIAIEKKDYRLNELFPIMNFVEGAYEFSNNNGELNLMLFKSMSLAKSKTVIYSMNIDASGEVTYLYENEYYRNPILSKHYILYLDTKNLYVNYIHNGGFISTPVSSKKLYTGKSAAVLSPLEYIFSKSNKDASNDLMYCVVPTDDANWIFQVDDTNSGIKLIQLKK